MHYIQLAYFVDRFLCQHILVCSVDKTQTSLMQAIKLPRHMHPASQRHRKTIQGHTHEEAWSVHGRLLHVPDLESFLGVIVKED